jgi:hypothetical protein
MIGEILVWKRRGAVHDLFRHRRVGSEQKAK